MIVLIILLVMSVFLGTELLAIPTPMIQLSLYRILIISAWLVSFFQFLKNNPQLKFDRRNSSNYLVLTYTFWWFWAFISIFWALSWMHWFRAVFLLSLGVSVILLLYVWVNSMRQWERVLQAMWVAMSGLVLWGYYEIITNHYLFADMEKLDKYHTFESHPFSRIPVTIFENQNDFATMLLAYLVVCLIMIHLCPGKKRKLFYLISLFMASYLIFRSESRMIFLSFVGLFLTIALLNFHVDFSRKTWRRFIFTSFVIIVFSVMFIGPVRAKVVDLFYIGYDQALNGDSIRVNLWRNGFHFLGQTWGMGVGAGNIEFWMANFADLPTRIITNMHNWWFEILVAYGFPVFISYILSYGYMIFLLINTRSKLPIQFRKVNNTYIAFLFVYIFASITSASNMLIEWHWVFFAVLLSYLKLVECITRNQKNEGEINELSDNI